MQYRSSYGFRPSVVITKQMGYQALYYHHSRFSIFQKVETGVWIIEKQDEYLEVLRVESESSSIKNQRNNKFKRKENCGKIEDKFAKKNF